MYFQLLHSMCVLPLQAGLIEVHWGVSGPEYDCVPGLWRCFFFSLSLPKLHVCPSLNHLFRESSVLLLRVQIRFKRRRAEAIVLSLSGAVEAGIKSHQINYFLYFPKIFQAEVSTPKEKSQWFLFESVFPLMLCSCTGLLSMIFFLFCLFFSPVVCTLSISSVVFV